MKKLFIDIETSPHVAYVWRLYDENVGLSQLIEPTRVICVAYQMDDGPMKFAAEWQAGGRKAMVDKVHKALCNADAVIHYNGTRFDETHLNREFIQLDKKPPSTYHTIDLYRVIKQRFRFASSKLEQVAKELEVREGKLKTDFSLWKRVMAGERAARAEMRQYNEEDVALLVDLYNQLLPWINRHPNVALYDGDAEMRCTRCGSDVLVKDGFQYTSAGRFQRYRCKDCGGQSRGRTRLATTPLAEVT